MILKSFQKNINLSKKVFVYPTETVYGLGCDSFNTKLVNKIFLIKGRKFNKALPLIAVNKKIVAQFFDLNQIEKELIKKYWPGPLTLILKNKFSKKFKNNKVWAQKKIAVRVSSDKIAQKLAKDLNGFVVSTSANLSTQPTCSSAEEVLEQFKNRKYKPDFIFDIGKIKNKKPSTIIEVLENGEVNVLRQGIVKIK